MTIKRTPAERLAHLRAGYRELVALVRDGEAPGVYQTADGDWDCTADDEDGEALAVTLTLLRERIQRMERDGR